MTRERQVVEQIVQLRRDENENAVAERISFLGLLHFYKWDRALDWQRRNDGTEIDDRFLQDCLDSHTDRDQADRLAMARNSLKEYAYRNQPRHGFWYGVMQSLVAWFLGLVVTFVIVKGYNLDLLGLLGVKLPQS